MILCYFVLKSDIEIYKKTTTTKESLGTVVIFL